MGKISNWDSSSLTEAVIVWTGWRQSEMPLRDDSLLVERFGSENGTKLLAIIKSLEDEFYSSDAKHVAQDLQEMGEMSANQFREKHPEIEDEIVQALAWCYTFDYK